MIVGGGPAGAAAACHLAQAGRKVLLLEKKRGAHHKVCGEFLSFEAQLYLRELDIDLSELGAAPLCFVRLIKGGHTVTARLPFTGLGLSRFVLDEQLLARAAAAGAQVQRGRKVTKILRKGEGWRAQLNGSEGFQAGALFLATGKHDLAGFERPPGRQNGFIGFKMHFACSRRQLRARAKHIDVVLFDGGYAGLQPIEADKVNLCMVIDRRRFAELGKRWHSLLEYLARSCSHLRGFLDEATPCWHAPEAIASIPYGYVCAEASGIYRLGDQFAVIPSFSGDGISIALHTARFAVKAFLNEERGLEKFHQRARQELRPQMRVATLIGGTIAHPLARRLGFATCKAWPSLVSRMAACTRLQAFC